MAILFSNPWYHPISGSVTTYPGAKLNFYRTGTTTRQDTWTSSALSVAHPNPVVADADGVFPAIYLGNASYPYKVVLTDADDVTLEEADPISGTDASVATLAELIALTSPASTRNVYVLGRSSVLDGYQGMFVWSSADLSTEVTADTQQAIHVAPSSDTSGASGAWVRAFHEEAKGEWFGTLTSGTADTALQAAINYCQANNKILKLPAGTISTTSRMDITNSIVIRGAGMDKTVIQGSLAGTFIILYSSNAAGIDRIDLSDFTVNGNNGGQLDSGLIQITQANFQIERVRVTGSTKVSGSQGINGIAVSSTSALEGSYGSGVIRDCIVDAVSKPGIYFSSYCFNGLIEGCISHSNTGNGSASGYSIVGKNCKLIGNVAYNNEGSGFFINATSVPYTPDRCILQGNVSYGNGTGTGSGSGIEIATSFGTNYGRILVEGNIIYDNGSPTNNQPGITVASEDNVFIDGNYIFFNHWHGIVVQDSTRTHIKNNIIEGNNQNNIANGAGIMLRNTTSKVEIIENHCFDEQGTKTQDHGIAFPSGTISDIKIRDNNLNGNSGSNINFAVTPTVIDIDDIEEVTTTDATLTNVLLLTPPQNTAYSVTTDVVALEAGGASDGAAMWKYSALIWNDGGTIAQVGTTTSVDSQLSANATTESWLHVIDDNTGSSVRTRIRGGAASTVNWKIHTKLVTVGV